ncbi:TAXI family TRAP transporter solute-binding subunit [Shimia abyssi]|uniref:TRAP-type uncharacterized transport system substrate-binding protein n=1 Tax=Shimia abyssi TaxID=1662395 RepID=A0A2P8FFD0_9RHOB|nr:TAXI family TRAP transporter solute-binding subunit [Shimia abyssi]PSL20419.1 TRAP-type uncharacterized transport system substrate-binding protein [Shimia abyssi]
MRMWIGLTTALLVAFVISVFVLLVPPKELTFAAGPQGGAYAAFADRYREILARDDIEVEIIHTNGSGDNARLLASGEADVAILQGGIDVPGGTAEAIGGIFFEPMMFMVRTAENIPKNPAHWRNLRITSGTPGSGTAAAFEDFQQAVGLDPERNFHLGLPYSEAIDALLQGDVHVAAFITTVDSPYLEQAYASPEISLLPLDYVDAISRRLSYATVTTVPSGAISLHPVIPARPLEVLALEARLAIEPDLHPALINRLTLAAKELHTQRDIITERDTFPTVDGTDMDINTVARQLIEVGPSTWNQWLPYWLAAQLNRMLLLILPVLLIFVPLFRILPSLYAYFMGWRVWQHYPQIRDIEDDLERQQDDENLMEMDRELVEMDERISRLRLPAAYRQAAYQARLHIDLVRSRINARRQTGR